VSLELAGFCERLVVFLALHPSRAHPTPQPKPSHR
jgi:hypothetical protein